MAYEQKNFENLIGMKGFSDTLLKNHFTLYQGYVTNANKLIDSLNIFLKESKTSTPEYAELKRRFGWEFNGMRLHEYYFKNLTKNFKLIDNKSRLFKKIIEDFGFYEDWEKEFKADAAMRGIGWVVLYCDPLSKKLFNVWINEHDVGHLSGCIPILILDVFEHAYMVDYGLKKADYIEAFFNAIDWNEVVERFECII